MVTVPRLILPRGVRYLYTPGGGGGEGAVNTESAPAYTKLSQSFKNAAVIKLEIDVVILKQRDTITAHSKQLSK